MPRRLPPRATPRAPPPCCARRSPRWCTSTTTSPSSAADDRAILDAKVPILQANTGVTLRISGHTDERGSDEYNLALGQRRAAAVKAYLVQHGIAESRIETISYGEERPIAQGSDESAFSQNRRAEFEITAGGQTLRKP